MLTEKEQITVDSYNGLARQWIETHQNTDVFDNAFPRFKGYLPQGEILEIGSGGGRDAVKIKRAGFGYVGMDISSGLLEEAKKSHPNIKFIPGNIYNPPNFGISFDGFWCAATLIHIPKARVGEALTNINQITRDGGVGFIALKEGEGDMVLEKGELDGQIFERYTTYYWVSEFFRILERNRFSVIDAYPLPVSQKTTWLNFFVETHK